MIEYITLTRRTDDPKLKWIEGELKKAGIRNKRVGHSFHGPIMQVEKSKLNQAMAILDPVDDIPDDDPRFKEAPESKPCGYCGGKGVRTPKKYAYNCRWCNGTGLASK